MKRARSVTVLLEAGIFLVFPALLAALPACGDDGPSATSPEGALAQRAAPLLAGRGALSVVGGRLVDEDGAGVRLTGVNWFGFETGNRVAHGLWARDYKSLLTQVRALGFNCLRIPWSNAILEPGSSPDSINYWGPDPYDQTFPMNTALKGKSSLEALDLIIATAGELGLRVILDNHSRKPDGYMSETLWYTKDFSEAQWIRDWRFVAQRYRGNPVVVGFDLDNEPHGDASWAEGNDSTDWRAAAERCGNAILEVNPDALILVEGVEVYQGKGYWWGSHLKGVRTHPIRLSDPSKLVYSPHEYGPEVYPQTWFDAPDFPANLPAIWDEHFGFIRAERLGHLLVGEFGLRAPDSAGGKAKIWFTRFLEYLGDTASWTFWCMNPNSGDTGGLLGYDWVTVEKWKLDLLRPALSTE